MTSRTNRNHSGPKQARQDGPPSDGVEERRRQALARYLDGDPIEDICRELNCCRVGREVTRPDPSPEPY